MVMIPLSAVLEAAGDDDLRKRLKQRRPAKKPDGPAEVRKHADSDPSRDTEAAKKAAQKKVDQAVAKSKEKRKKALQKRRKEQMATAAAEMRAKQKARRQQLIDKQKTQAAKKAAKAPVDTVPAQLAHCILAVHIKRGKSVRAAWNICRWSLTKYGYLKGPYREDGKLPGAAKQTAKGSKRSAQHAMEKKPLNGGIPGTGASKYAIFKNVFKELEPFVAPGGV